MNAGAIIGIIGPILLALLQWWQGQQPARDQEKRNEEIQKGRQDIASGNVDAVAERIDRVLTVQTGVGAGGASGGGASAPEGGDADTLRRLAALGIGTGEVAGKS